MVVFCHGYKGFKDWGAWNQVAQAFAKCGFAFVKFNFSYNGGTSEQPIDFPDEEAFAENNYSTELGDLRCVVEWLLNEENPHRDEINLSRIQLIGHSRGGGIALLGAATIPHINRLALWASVSDFEVRFPYGRQMKEWEETGVWEVLNARTGQVLKHHYQFYEDFVRNREVLDIRSHAKQLKTPVLIAHGVEDEAVHFSEAMRLYKWTPESRLEMVPETGHTFGSRHPWEEDILPEALGLVVEYTVDHFRN